VPEKKHLAAKLHDPAPLTAAEVLEDVFGQAHVHRGVLLLSKGGLDPKLIIAVSASAVVHLKAKHLDHPKPIRLHPDFG
jgi:hypothetical protein